MKIINISGGNLSIKGLLGGRDLVLNVDETSNSILPNQEMIRRLLHHKGSIKLDLESSMEMEIISSVDPTASEFIK